MVSRDGGEGVESAPTRRNPGRAVSPPTVYARFATTCATAPNEALDAVVAGQSLHTAIGDDPRVVAIEPLTASPEFSDWTVLYPHVPGSDPDTVLTGEDKLFSLQVLDPIRFVVRVPQKNQPLVNGFADVPTDTYCAAWDGTVLTVAWEQPANSGAVPMSAGHVVLEIISDACESVGLGNYRQGCSPGCHFGFIHTTMKIQVRGTAGEPEFEATDEDQLALAWLEQVPNTGWAAYEIWYTLRGPGTHFAAAKNSGQRVFDLEQLVSRNSYHLLSHFHTHALSRIGRLDERLKKKWANRGWRSEARSLTSGVWLGLAGVETVRQVWASELAELSVDDNVDVLFGKEIRADAVRMERLDVETARQTADHIMAHLADRTMASATLLGTMGGALAGAIAAALLT